MSTPDSAVGTGEGNKFQPSYPSCSQFSLGEVLSTLEEMKVSCGMNHSAAAAVF